MKKACFVMIFVFLCMVINAFEGRGNAQIRVFSNEPPLSYDFFNVDLNNIEDIISLGLWLGTWEHMSSGLLLGSPRSVIRNNTDLSQAVKDRMRHLGANVSTTFYSGYFYINILLRNGTYTTIIYEPTR